jgi:enoyl-CoA hydratase
MSQVRCDITESVALVTLDDAARRNALNLDMVSEIAALFDELEANAGVGAVVVTGAPPAFCAGADLSHLGSSEEEGLRLIYEGFLRVGCSPLPTIAAVNGAAVGAGMNLALACDLRLAARSARFDARFLQLGMHPGGGHTWMFRRIAGPQAVFASVVFAEVLDGSDAERVGLAWRCVDDDALLDEARTLAGRAARAPRELVQRTKTTINDMASVAELAAAVERELAAQLWSVRQPAFRERLAALQARISSKP